MSYSLPESREPYFKIMEFLADFYDERLDYRKLYRDEIEEKFQSWGAAIIPENILKQRFGQYLWLAGSFKYTTSENSIDFTEMILVIYTRWYMLKNGPTPAKIQIFNNRQWFIEGLKYLLAILEDWPITKNLTSNSPVNVPYPLIGKIVKLEIYNFAPYYGLTHFDHEDAQYLRLSKRETCFFIASIFGNHKMRIEQPEIDEQNLTKIFSGLRYYLEKPLNSMTVQNNITQVKNYVIRITDDHENVFELSRDQLHWFEWGSIESDISGLIRKNLPINDMYLLDDNTHYFKRLVLDYRQNNSDDKESLEINNETGLLSYIRIENNDDYDEPIKVAYRIQNQDLIKTSFEDFWLAHPEDRRVVDETEDKKYHLLVEYKNFPALDYAGIFDRIGLPSNFSNLVENLRDIMSTSMFGQIFDPKIYGRGRKDDTEFIVCEVTFQKGGTRYSYLTSDETIKIGDKVFVPVGYNGQQKIVKVVGIRYLNEADLPLPLDKLKWITRRGLDPDEEIIL